MKERSAPDSGIIAEWLVERRWKRWIWIGLGLLLLAYIAFVVREIWLPLAVAFLIAMVLDPVVDRLEHRGWSRAMGASLIFFVFLLILGTVLFFAVPVIFKEGEHIAGQVHTLVPDTSPGAIDATLVKNHVSSPARSLILTGVDQLHHTVAQSGTWIAQNGVRVASNLIWIVIIPIVAFYALKDFHLILAKLLLLVPRQRRDLVSTLVSEVSAIFAKYMRGLALVSLLNGLATWGLLAVLHVPNAFTLGAIAGVLYSVPYLGALTTILIVALVTFVAKGLDQMLIVVAANIVLHQIVFDQIISPRILGGHVGLHPILSIVALLVGNALLGIVGMVLAVPVAASIQIAVLALVPKLNQDIDLSSQTAPGTETGSELATKTKEDQVKVDATEELHKNVSDAVEHVEAAIHDGDDATAQAIKTQAIQEHVEKLEADFIEAHQSDPGQK